MSWRVETFQADETPDNAETFELADETSTPLRVFVDGKRGIEWTLRESTLLELASPPAAAEIVVVYQPDGANVVRHTQLPESGPIPEHEYVDWDAVNESPESYYARRAAQELHDISAGVDVLTAVVLAAALGWAAGTLVDELVEW
jgi:hypothetical protein